MQFFAKAVITGFGLSLGAAIYKKVAKQLGFEDDKASEQVRQQDGATDPELQNDKPQPKYS
jgi:hypothetical protein